MPEVNDKESRNVRPESKGRIAQLVHSRAQSYMVAVAILVVGVGAGFVIDKELLNNTTSAEHRDVSEVLVTLRDAYSTAIAQRLIVLQGVAALAISNPDIDQESFARFAESILHANRQVGVRSIQLARDSKISHMYPLATNQKALGIDLTVGDTSGALARAIALREPLLSGPRTLVQGGRGLIINQPVFVPVANRGEQFWGIATVVVDVETFETDVGVEYWESLLDLRVDTSKSPASDPVPDREFDQPESIQIEVPGALWTVTAVPRDGWSDAYTYQTEFRILGSCFLLVIALLAAMVARQPRRVYEAVESVRAEERQAAARFRAVAHNAAIAFLVVNEDGNVRFANAAAIVLVGQTYSLTGHNVAEFLRVYSDDTRPLTDTGSIAAWCTGEVRATITTNRDSVPVRIVASPTEIDDENVFVLVIEDLRPAENAESARRAAESRLLAVQKRELVGTLAASVAHDINNLLIVVLAAIDGLKHSPVHSTIRSEVGDLSSATERVSNLSNQLLELSSARSNPMKAVDPSRTVKDAVAMCIKLLPPSVTVESDIDSPLPPVLADPNQLDQVVMNLVLNAGEAIGSAKGVVRISMTAVNLDTPVQAFDGEIKSGRYLRLSVEDDGPGVDPLIRDNLFQPFHTTKDAGTGLGLANVARIVERHHGNIVTTFPAGGGTRFDVYVPVASEMADTAA